MDYREFYSVKYVDTSINYIASDGSVFKSKSAFLIHQNRLNLKLVNSIMYPVHPKIRPFIELVKWIGKWIRKALKQL